MKIIKIKKTKIRNIYTEKLKVAAYVRVSTKSDAQVTSFESQYIYYKQKIEKNANWKFVDIYYDYGISGRSTKKRKGFQQMIKDCNEGKINLILTKNISRFARNTVDSLAYVRRLKSQGIGVIFEEEHINTLELGGEMLLSIFSSIAQIESENKSLRQNYGYYMSLKNKTRVMNFILYGYKYNKNTKKITLNKKEANAVKGMFDAYNKNGLKKDALEYLEKIKAKPWHKKKWTKITISQMLENTKYLGTASLEASIYGEETAKLEITIPRIIDDKTFYEVQEKLRQKSDMFNFKNYKDYSEYPFKGKIKCGFCKRNLSLRKNELNYKIGTFLCDNGTRHKCDGKSINMDQMKNIANGLFKEILKTGDNNFSIKNITSIIEKLESKKSIIETNMSILTENYLNNKISKITFDSKFEKLNKLLETINDEINSNQNKRDKIKYYRKSLLKVIKEVKKNYNNEFDIKLFNKIVSYLFLGTTLENNRKSPYNIRFILDLEYMNGKIPREELKEIKTVKILEYNFYANLLHAQRISKKRVITKYIKVTYEIREVQNGSSSN